MAKKTGRKDQISAASLHQELRRPWLVPVLAVFYFLITCLMKHGANKGITLLLLAAAVVCVVVKTAQLGRRMSWPALLLGLYICMDGISTLYAPSGKFALYEFLKVAGAACLALLLTALEPERPGRTGRCAATVLETAGQHRHRVHPASLQADGVLYRPVRRVHAAEHPAAGAASQDHF